MEKNEKEAVSSLKLASLAPKEEGEAHPPRGSVYKKIECIISPPPQSDHTPRRHHYQHKMTQKEVDDMLDLMDVCGFATKKELLNNAIEILEWMTRGLREGREIISYQPEDKSVLELQMPFFSNVRRPEST